MNWSCFWKCMKPKWKQVIGLAGIGFLIAFVGSGGNPVVGIVVGGIVLTVALVSSIVQCRNQC